MPIEDHLHDAAAAAVGEVAEEGASGGEPNLEDQWRAAMAEMEDEWDDDASDEEEHPLQPIDVVSDALPPLMGQDDPHRMKLSREEWDIAQNIKRILATNPEVDNNMSDYKIAQLAVICNSLVIPPEEAIQRTLDLQTFQREYDIRDTLEQGCHAIEDLIELFPEYLLHFGFQQDKGTYIFAFDISKFDTSGLYTSESNFRIFMRGYFYLIHSMNCDLASIRQGPMAVIDCGNVGWTMKNDFKVLKEFFSQLVCVYPFQPSSIKHYNTGVIFNLLFSMAKKVLPKKKKEPHEFGFTSDGPLKDILLVPTVEIASHRIILQMQEALKRRYENERTFILD